MVIRAEDIGPPKPINDSDFKEICGTFNVPLKHEANLRLRLDEVIKTFATLIENAGRQPSHQMDAKAIKWALSHIQKAQTRLLTCGPAAQTAIGATAPLIIGQMVSAAWLRKNFPADPRVPKPKVAPGPRADRLNGWRAGRYDIEDFSLPARRGFVADSPVETISAILHDVEHGLDASLRRFRLLPGARGGRKPLALRKFFLVNLVEIWDELGKRLAVGPNSHFVAFCEAVAEAIDWPTEGVASAVPDAISLWRNLSQKEAR